MFSIEKATEYILATLNNQDSIQKCPAAFRTESATWIHDWLLKGDPITEKILTNPAKSEITKKDLLEGKLEALLQNAAFAQALDAKLKTFSAYQSSALNVITKTDLDITGKFQLGNTGNPTTTRPYAKENVIEDSKIKVGGDFRMGNDVVQGNKTEVHHYAPAPIPNTPLLNEKATLFQLLSVNKVGEVIKRLLLRTDGVDNALYSQISMVSSRFHRINSEEQMGTASKTDVNVERNQITKSLTEIMEQLS
jgi:Effector-associated domain 11